ncbi:MAG: hypothetical protein U0793_15130 [Gemmataceae bacterium]
MTDQENAPPTPERPSFFGLPPTLRYMSRALFWGGVLFGAGFGVLLTAVLVAMEVIKPERTHWDHWVSVMVLAFVLVGQAIAQKAVRPRQQPHQEQASSKKNEAEAEAQK